MPKTDASLDLQGYATVAERITLFYERFPSGRINTELVSHVGEEITFKAAVYRTDQEQVAAATGWASEREGDGDINSVACLENAETSAIGRALANLGFTASARRPSREEMDKADRARRRLAIATRASGAGPTSDRSKTRPPATHNDPMTSDTRAAVISDIASLIARAQRLGLRPVRAARWLESLKNAQRGGSQIEVLIAMERRLRQWLVGR